MKTFFKRFYLYKCYAKNQLEKQYQKIDSYPVYPIRYSIQELILVISAFAFLYFLSH